MQTSLEDEEDWAGRQTETEDEAYDFGQSLPLNLSIHHHLAKVAAATKQWWGGVGGWGRRRSSPADRLRNRQKFDLVIKYTQCLCRTHSGCVWGTESDRLADCTTTRPLKSGSNALIIGFGLLRPFSVLFCYIIVLYWICPQFMYGSGKGNPHCRNPRLALAPIEYRNGKWKRILILWCCEAKLLHAPLLLSSSLAPNGWGPDRRTVLVGYTYVFTFIIRISVIIWEQRETQTHRGWYGQSVWAEWGWMWHGTIKNGGGDCGGIAELQN